MVSSKETAGDGFMGAFVDTSEEATCCGVRVQGAQQPPRRARAATGPRLHDQETPPRRAYRVRRRARRPVGVHG